MVELETVDELADAIADMLGIYGVINNEDQTIVDHEKNCQCRICFVCDMSERIRNAVANEKLLYPSD